MTRNKKRRPKYDVNQRHNEAMFCGLVSFLRISAGVVNDIAENLQSDCLEDAVGQLEEILAESAVLQRLAEDALSAAAKIK